MGSIYQIKKLYFVWNTDAYYELAEYLKSDLLYSSGVVLTDWFGKEKNKDSDAKASNIIIEESVINDAKKIELTYHHFMR